MMAEATAAARGAAATEVAAAIGLLLSALLEQPFEMGFSPLLFSNDAWCLWGGGGVPSPLK